MEDSTAMTIEFLRARLLSERSVSRSARQRVDELERMVYLMLWQSLWSLSCCFCFKEPQPLSFSPFSCTTFTIVFL